MLELLIKNKIVSLKGSSKVTDIEGNLKFVVKGAVFSMRRRKTVEDEKGNVLYKVQNKLINWILHSSYVLDAKGHKIAQVKEKFKLIKNEFYVKGFEDEIEINGDIISRHFQIIKNGETIGEIKQHFMVMSDTFTLTCYKEEDAAFLVALVIAIDNIFDNKS